MTASNPLARSVLPLHPALVAAGSPHHWHCQLHDALCQLHAHSYPSDWIGMFTSMDVEISSQPLFGETLALLTAPQPMAGEVAPATRATSRPLPVSPRWTRQGNGVPGPAGAPAAAGKGSRAMVPVGSRTASFSGASKAENAGTSRMSPRPSQRHLHPLPQHLERRARVALLKRLCSPQEIQPASAEAIASSPLRSILFPEASSRHAAPVRPTPPDVPGLWASKLADRTIRSLPHLMAAHGGAPAIAREWNWNGSALGSQWRLPLRGITAPVALLSRWQQEIPGAGDAAPAAAAPVVSPGLPPPLIGSGRLSSARPPSARSEPPSAAVAMPALDVQALERQPAGLAPLLSYLVRPEEPRSPAPLAGAGADPLLAIEPEEELEELAIKIKRILDEEARRYGIDV